MKDDLFLREKQQFKGTFLLAFEMDPALSLHWHHWFLVALGQLLTWAASPQPALSTSTDPWTKSSLCSLTNQRARKPTAC